MVAYTYVECVGVYVCGSNKVKAALSINFCLIALTQLRIYNFLLDYKLFQLHINGSLWASVREIGVVPYFSNSFIDGQV